ncbi:hypothetical protein BDV95DRAFT_563612 [Massariosphaeria phaeospora]|uniref:DUF924-domain-containing protein n=1 Tax=Massariosphaeria phaeospora TaxID=100035 RepID=A0A7C8ME90_9PLEO|nr:hypothetical protein BDV95DRAFT_563612 [Massariosphaeria phaeospora]
MLIKSIVRSNLPRRLFSYSTLHRRPMSTFTLNKDLFNASLYSNLRNVWFEGWEPNDQEFRGDVVKKWFLGTPEEKLAFDTTCRENFAPALDSIGPDKFPNPTAEPFLREIQDAVQNSPANEAAEAARTALSLVLLLDQIPRNIFRTDDGLVKVYTHYDKIAYSLMTALMASDSPLPRPDLHPQWRKSGAYRMWFYLPFIHTEDTKEHDRVDEILATFKTEIDKEDGHEATRIFLQKSQESGKEHRDILDRFGRYPHRNTPLGRASTDEEKRFLAEGGATFGVGQQKKGM